MLQLGLSRSQGQPRIETQTLAVHHSPMREALPREEFPKDLQRGRNGPRIETQLKITLASSTVKTKRKQACLQLEELRGVVVTPKKMLRDHCGRPDNKVQARHKCQAGELS